MIRFTLFLPLLILLNSGCTNSPQAEMSDNHSANSQPWVEATTSSDRRNLEVNNIVPGQADSDENKPPRLRIAEAVYGGDLESLKSLEEAFPHIVRMVDISGNFINRAARSGQCEIIEYLIGLGLDVNDASSPACPLHDAIAFKQFEAAELILKRGANPNLGRSIIGAINTANSHHDADKELALRLVKLLVEYGVDVNQLFDTYGDEKSLFSALDMVKSGPIHDYLRSVGAKTAQDLQKEGRQHGEIYSRDGKRIQGPTSENREAIKEAKLKTNTRILANEVVEYFSAKIGYPERKTFIEIVPGLNPITVYSIPAAENRPYITLFTTGLSSRPMNVPTDVPDSKDYKYAELFIQLPADWKIANLDDPKWNWPIRQLHWLAKYPHANGGWLGTPVTIVDHGDPPTPISPEGTFDSMLLIPEQNFWSSQLSVDVQLYRVSLLYPEERELERKQGYPPLMRAFDKASIPFVIDMHRKNAAKK